MCPPFVFYILHCNCVIGVNEIGIITENFKIYIKEIEINYPNEFLFVNFDG
jgi:Tfp pilus assembly ATPase PilU